MKPEHGPGCGPGFDREFEQASEPGCGPHCGPERFARGERRHAFGPMRGPMHGPGARFERGGIKFAILGMLKDKPRHGYDIIKEMEERSGGFYSPSPGVVYPTLQALEDQDLVTSTAEEGKKVYSLTEVGLAFLEEHKERAKSHRERFDANWGPGPQGAGWGVMADIRDTLGDVKRAVRRSAGDPDKLKEIGAVLEEAASKIKEIIKR